MISCEIIVQGEEVQFYFWDIFVIEVFFFSFFFNNAIIEILLH